MQTIKLDEIKILENRHRRVFDENKIALLARSIKDKGLLHAPILRKNGDELQLVAGERRLRAIALLNKMEAIFNFDDNAIPPGETPYVLISELPPIKVREAELEENLIREDLTWQERDLALAELDKLRKAQGKSKTTADTVREVAEATDTPIGTVRKELDRANIVAQHLHDPDVARAKNSQEAYNIIARKTESEFADILAKRGVGKKTPHTLIHGDFKQADLPEGVFDCIVCDPPYGVDADEFSTQAKLGGHKYDDSPDVALELIYYILKKGLDLTKPEAHIYLFCDIEHFLRIRDISAGFGWIPWRTPLIWDKGNLAMLPSPDYGPRRSTELIFYARKGNRRTTAVYSDIIDLPNVKYKEFSAEKPPELFANLATRCCYPGDLILDPCCGTGPIFGAADMLGLKATGVELDEDAFKEAQRRLQT